MTERAPPPPPEDSQHGDSQPGDDPPSEEVTTAESRPGEAASDQPAPESPDTPTAPDTPTGRARAWLRARHEVLWLFLLALAVRALAAAFSQTLPRDAVGLLDAARAIASRGAAAIFELPLHPLSPAAIAAAGTWVDEEMAATALAVVCGALAVWPLHALARRAVGRHAAGAACLLYVALPKAVQLSAVPMTEALLLPAFLSSLAFAAWACQGTTRGARRASAAGLLAAVAYLIRPEGLIAAAVAGTALLLARGRRVRRVVAFTLVFLLVAAPYAVGLSRDRGRLTLSPKKDVARFVGVDGTRPTRAAVPVPSDARLATTAAEAIGGTASALEGALTLPVLLLALAGLLTPRGWRRRHSRLGRAFTAGTALVLVALVVRLQFGWGYGGGRHLITAGVLLLPYAGAGLFVLARMFPRVRSRRRFALFVALIIAIPLAARAVLRSPGQGGLSVERLGAEVARASQGDRELVVASVAEPRVAYYARQHTALGVTVSDLPLFGPYVDPLERGAPLKVVSEQLSNALVERRADWIVLDLWRTRRGENGPEHPHRALYEELLQRGRIERRALPSGTGLAAYRVLR